MWRDYHVVDSIEQALEILKDNGPSARIIAGGTDMIIELDRKMRPNVDTLIDITRVHGLDEISRDSAGTISLGPLVTHNQCAASDVLRDHALPLAQACWEVGAPQIRNRSTIAGNLITASPANDTITPLVALGGVVTLSSTTGQRKVNLSDFYLGVRKTVMRSDEIMTAIEFPSLLSDEIGIFQKLGLRRAQAIAVVNVCAILQLDQSNKIVCSEARIALGSIAPTIIRMDNAENVLRGHELNAETIERAALLSSKAVTPIDDLRSSADYRRNMVKVLTRRALSCILNNDVKGSFPDKPVLLGGGVEVGKKSFIPRSWLTNDTQLNPAIITRVNGNKHEVIGASNKTLMNMLRDDLGLVGTKEGCSEGECGACTVHLDGAAVMSCLVPAPRAHGADIVTIEGIADEDNLHPLQQAFIDSGAVQCGYCTPGLLMSGVKLLSEVSMPSRSETEQAITGNLCRGTGYYKIFDAIERAAKSMS
ncbi:MAG: FAD binding domain-containing protein [Chloroflexota bacterium]|nr:FAD binding domain-containing protein [Chloroflexota bacterium]